jgi:RNA polymerase sigma factor (sigma-70 family)
MAATTIRPIFVAADPGRDARNRALASRARKGDREARHMLIDENRGIAGRLAWSRSERYGVPFDDALSDAFIALIEAADHYDPASSAFTTYARRIIVGRFIDADKAKRAQKRGGRSISLGSAEAIIDGGPGPAEVVERRDLARALLARLIPEHRRVLLLVFGMDGEEWAFRGPTKGGHDPIGVRTFQDVGDRLGLSKTVVGKRVAEAIAELREMVGRESA